MSDPRFLGQPYAQALHDRVQGLRDHRYFIDFVDHLKDVRCAKRPIPVAAPFDAVIADFESRWAGVTKENPDTRSEQQVMLEAIRGFFDGLPVPSLRLHAGHAHAFCSFAAFSRLNQCLGQLVEDTVFGASP